MYVIPTLYPISGHYLEYLPTGNIAIYMWLYNIIYDFMIILRKYHRYIPWIHGIPVGPLAPARSFVEVIGRAPRFQLVENLMHRAHILMDISISMYCILYDIYQIT